MSPFFRYKVHGLYVQSCLELPELVPDPHDGVADHEVVAVRLGSIPPLARVPEEAPGAFVAGPDQVIYAIPKIGHMRVRGGREVVIDRVAGTEDSELRVYILGIGLATLLLQRGMLVLHASGVMIAGGAVLFLGGKGFGKSTMAAALHERGHPLITDDLAPILLESGEAPKVYSGFPQMKLWPEAAKAALETDPDLLPRLYSAVEKRVRRLHDHRVPDLLPLRGIFVLGHGDTIEIRPLTTREAFQELTLHTFLAKVTHASGARPRHLQQCAELLRRLSVHLLQRPKNLGLLASVAEALESHMTELEPEP